MTRDELMSRLRAGPRAIHDALAHVELDASPGPHEWTPRQIAHHVADADLINAVRLRRLIAEDNPHIAGYDEETYTRTLRYERPVDASLAMLAAVREATCSFLDSLSDDEWLREGTHDELGAYSVAYCVERTAGHALDHAEQILRCKP